MVKSNVVNNSTDNREEKSETKVKNAMESYSIRMIKDVAKIYAEYHGDDVVGLVETFFEKAKTDAKYAEMLVKLLGGFDPVETKDVTERPIENPYMKFTREELKEMLKDE